MSLFGSKESFLGVDIGAHGIKLVELHKQKNRPQLWTYGIVDQNLDIHIPAVEEKTADELRHEHDGGGKKDTKEETPLQKALMADTRIEEYANLLHTLMQEARVNSKRVTSSLPVSNVFHAVINLPEVEEKEIGHIVRAEIAKMLTHPIDDMQVVYQKMPEDNKQKRKFLQVLVTAAPKTLVAFYTAIFQKAGLELQELETEAFALSRSLVGQDNSVSMVVDMGAERTNFFIVDSGLPATHRSLQIGGNDIDRLLQDLLQIDQNLIRQIKKDISSGQGGKIPSEPFHRILDQIVKEIQYSFDLYIKQIGHEDKRPQKIILTGGSAFFPPFVKYLQDAFQLKVFVGDPWARVIYQDGLKQILDEIGPRMSVSIGLALRNF